MLNSSISASGLNRNPQNIRIYSSGFDPAPSLISNYFSILEMTSDKKGFKETFIGYGTVLKDRKFMLFLIISTLATIV